MVIKPEIDLTVFLSIMTQNMTEVRTVFLKSDLGDTAASILNIIESLEQIHVLILIFRRCKFSKITKAFIGKVFVFFSLLFVPKHFTSKSLIYWPAKGMCRTDPIH